MEEEASAQGSSSILASKTRHAGKGCPGEQFRCRDDQRGLFATYSLPREKVLIEVQEYRARESLYSASYQGVTGKTDRMARSLERWQEQMRVNFYNPSKEGLGKNLKGTEP